MAITITYTQDTLANQPNMDGVDVAASEDAYAEELERAMRERFGAALRVRYTNTWGAAKIEVDGASAEECDEIETALRETAESVWERGEFYVSA